MNVCGGGLLMRLGLTKVGYGSTIAGAWEAVHVAALLESARLVSLPAPIVYDASETSADTFQLGKHRIESSQLLISKGMP